MNRRAAIVFVSCSLFIAACATHARTSTPVGVTITSDTATDNFVKQVRDNTIDVIAEQVPNARPMTINVKLDVSERMQSTPSIGGSMPPSIGWSMPPVNEQRPVPSLSSDRYNDGPPPTVPVNNSVFQSQTSEQITSYRVVYTIRDAAGQVVESNQLTLDNGHLVDAKAGALKPRYGLIGDTAMFLASRVKTLDQ
jgi:hypothetical protein